MVLAVIFTVRWSIVQSRARIGREIASGFHFLPVRNVLILSDNAVAEACANGKHPSFSDLLFLRLRSVVVQR